MKALNSFSGQVLTATTALLLPLFTWVLSSQFSTQPMITPLNDNMLNLNLRGRDFLIVGGMEGLGASLAKELNNRGGIVTVTGTSHGHFLQHLPRSIEQIHANTSTMRGAQDLATYILQGRKFDTVVFTGGFVPRPLVFASGEGSEEDIQTAYLSRFIILRELIKNEALVGRKRVYIVAYPGEDHMLTEYEDMWFGWPDHKTIPSYINTVLFNDGLIKEAARRYPDLKVFGVNPGFLSGRGASDLHWEQRHLLSRMFDWLFTIGIKSPEQYVRNALIQIIGSADLDTKSGAYINDKMEELPPKRWFQKESNRIHVWENSEKMVGMALG